MKKYDRYIIGIDLGQANDWTAGVVCGIMDGEESMVDVGHIIRPPLKTKYRDVMVMVKELIKKFDIPEDVKKSEYISVVIDATGVGVPVAEDFEEDEFLSEYGIVAVTITGGSNQTEDESDRWDIIHWNVAKKILVSALQIALQNGRIKVSLKLPHADILTREMENFKAKITVSGNEIYEAWREEGTNDDLVIALALAVWYSNLPLARGAWF